MKSMCGKHSCIAVSFIVRSNDFETTDNGAQEDDQVSVNTMVEKGELTESILMASGRFQVHTY